ncbi:hypothetical protein KIM322_08080 [Lactobacillus xylocopicola]|uniref:Nudix hydrolase domain-containing protein n=1 Tax=Lactobacillus xylocopicola TaxID=2976676 RepID=A0ABM8BHG7_9LACO|nr:hypothetical protein KIM322_08080 [Lactobacillus xylocopicola]
MSSKYHRAFGCYGIIADQQKLLVIKKTGGPYINRYDLPGGSLEDGEALTEAVVREVREETGLTALAFKQVGVTSFKYPWDYESWHYNQHICVLYDIEQTKGNVQAAWTSFLVRTR